MPFSKAKTHFHFHQREPYNIGPILVKVNKIKYKNNVSRFGYGGVVHTLSEFFTMELMPLNSNKLCSQDLLNYS